MKRIIVVVGVLLFLSDSHAWADAPAAKPARVPFQMLKTRHMLVQVKINGKGPYPLIFDTGAPVMLINTKLAKEAKVLPKNFRPPLFAPFGSLGQFTIKDMQLGGVKAKGIPTVVMNHPTVGLMAKALKKPIYGIVGFSFFARYRMTIDYQKKEMTFVPTKFKPPDIMKEMMTTLLDAGHQPKTKVIQPAGVWGFSVGKAKNDKKAGVTISHVVAKSAAAKAGLKKGDRLLVLDDRWTDSVVDCYEAAKHVKPGSSVNVTIERGGKKMQKTIQVKAGL